MCKVYEILVYGVWCMVYGGWAIQMRTSKGLWRQLEAEISNPTSRKRRMMQELQMHFVVLDDSEVASR